MRVNVYAEEMTEDMEIITKVIEGHEFTALRLYLHLPVTLPSGEQAKGPFMHHPGDDDSSAVTFWGKQDLRVVLRKALSLLDEHYAKRNAARVRQEARKRSEVCKEFMNDPYTSSHDLRSASVGRGEVSLRRVCCLRCGHNKADHER